MDDQERTLGNMQATVYSLADALSALDAMPEHKLRAVYKQLIHRIVVVAGQEPHIIPIT